MSSSSAAPRTMPISNVEMKRNPNDPTIVAVFFDTAQPGRTSRVVARNVDETGAEIQVDTRENFAIVRNLQREACYLFYVEDLFSGEKTVLRELHSTVERPEPGRAIVGGNTRIQSTGPIYFGNVGDTTVKTEHSTSTTHAQSLLQDNVILEAAVGTNAPGPGPDGT